MDDGIESQRDRRGRHGARPPQAIRRFHSSPRITEEQFRDAKPEHNVRKIEPNKHEHTREARPGKSGRPGQAPSLRNVVGNQIPPHSSCILEQEKKRTANGDSEQRGCAPGCQLPHFCGDGVVDTEFGESCDNGVANSAAAYGPDGCTDQCQPAPYCGDGFLNGSEECDDGPSNGTPASDCDLSCLIGCGNGVVEEGEQCDDGSANGTASSTCDVRCYFKCGNGIRDTGEECDNSINDGSYGTCNPDCTLPDYCGDGIVNGPEECDLGDANQDDPYGPDLCSTACLIAPYCGDGLVDAEYEDCDGQGSCGANCMWTVPE